MHYLVGHGHKICSHNATGFLAVLLLYDPKKEEKIMISHLWIMIVRYEYGRKYRRLCGLAIAARRFIYCFIRFAKPYHQQWSPRLPNLWHASVFVLCCAVDTHTNELTQKAQYTINIVCVRSMDDDDESILSVFIGPSQINGFSNACVIQLDWTGNWVSE